jgi:hypothetical protein
MTETELEILRLRLRAEVHQLLLRGLYTGLANSSPTAAQEYRRQFAALRKQHSQLAIRGVDAAQSELIAGEFQEALEDVLSNIEAGFRY